MSFKDKLNRNINKQYWFMTISSLDLTRGLWMLFLAYKGLNLFQIGLMETIFHISSFMMEIPTGAIADIYGKKTSRILGRMSSIISILLMIFGTNVYFYAVAFVFSALSYNLESGAGEALIYDSLKELGREKEFTKVNGIVEVCFQMASVFSLLIGGYIANMSFDNVYRISLVIAIVVLIQAFTFTEPTIGKVKKQDSLIKTFIKQIKDSFGVVRNDSKIFWMIVGVELFGTFYVTEFFYVQNKLKALGLTPFEIGIILAISSVAAAIFASQTHRWEKRFSITTLMKVSSAAAIVCFWGMSIVGIERYAIVLLSAIEAMLFVLVGDFLNKRIPSEQRATVLSLQSMTFSLFMIVLFPIVGKIGDMYSLGTAFVVVGVLATIVLSVIIIKLNSFVQEKE